MQPIDHCLPKLLAALDQHNTALLQAPPGAGKTTRVPPALLQTDWLGDRRLLMLEPRRLAARSAARFMARQRGERPGDTVGFRTRDETRVSAQTRIEVVTEGVLTRLIQEDPALEAYGAVLFDEFHERSLQADLGLALVRESQEALREDLRLLIMSATLDTEPLAELLGDVPVVTSEGRAYPVVERYRPMAQQGRLPEHVAGVIREALDAEPGSVLVFLPGVGDIRRVTSLLEGTLPEDSDIAPLYGNLKASEQDQAIAAPPEGRRKVVLATAIAESSLTIDGIRVVVDAGRSRRARFDPNSGMSRLVTERVSRASADQRKGRAGRLEPGVCYRLWSESEHQSLASHTPPEILEADLAPLVLELARWGARNPNDLQWLDRPPEAHWAQAKDLLEWLDIVDAEGAITAHGESVARLGIHPRLGHMVIRGRRWGYPVSAAMLAALLSERDPHGPGGGTDLARRIEAMGANRNDGRYRAVWQSARRLIPGKESDPEDNAPLGSLLALAYPDRIARRRKGGDPRFQLSNGRGARMSDQDPLAGESWLVAADLDGQAREATIYRAALIDQPTVETVLAGHIRETEDVGWDDRRGEVTAVMRRCLGKLVLDEKRLSEPSAEQKVAGLMSAIRRHGMDSLPWTEKARQWQARVALLHRHQPEDWPDVSDATLLESLEDWLAPFLTGPVNRQSLERLDMGVVLSTILSFDQQQRLETEAPERLTLPTGQAARLDYTAENGPVLATKLQSVFGWTITPRIVFGQVPIVLALLSPAQRPLAVTADLASFWDQAYPQVRKEMRGRYPKHPWPENPLEAEPSHGTKKRRS